MGNEEKLTWAEVVKMTLNTIRNASIKGTTIEEKELMYDVRDAFIRDANAISLARIATALYEIAGLEDNITEEDVE